MTAIYFHATAGTYRRFDSRAAADLWLLGPGRDGFATANQAAAACAVHNDSESRSYREDSMTMQTNGVTPTPDLRERVQAEIDQFSLSKKSHGATGMNITAADRIADRLMRARCAEMIGYNCDPLASDDTLLALAGASDLSVRGKSPAEQAEFARGMAAGKAALDSEGSNSHEAQSRANAEAFNSSFTGSDYRAGLK